MTAIPFTPAPLPMPAGVGATAAPVVTEVAVPQAIHGAAGAGVLVDADVRVDAGVRVLLVEELEQVAARVGELLAQAPDIELIGTVGDGSAAIGRIADTSPDVVIIDALLQGRTSGLELARSVRASGLAVPIVFLTVPDRPLRPGPDMGHAATLMLPLDGKELLATIARLDDAHRGPVAVPPSGTVAVFSAKGGVGRTTIAHNLAVALNRLPATRVVLVDGDLAHGDLRLHLDAPESAPSLLQLPTGHVTDADMLPLLWRDAAGVDVLLSPPRMEQADLIVQADVRHALAALRRIYDTVVIDVPAVMDDTTLAIMDDADVILDVVTTERGSLAKARRCHAVLEAAAFPLEKVATIVNQAGPAGIAGPTLEAALGRPTAATLPYDERLASRGSPPSGVVADAADSPLGLAYLELAGLVAARIRGDAGSAAARAA